MSHDRSVREGRITIASDSTVLWRPPLAAAALAVCVGGIEAAASEFHPDTNLRLFIGATVGFVLLLGLAQSMSWWLRFGKIVYTLDQEGIHVSRNAKSLHAWRWSEIHSVHVRGTGLGWSTYLATRGSPASEHLPHLVVHSRDGRTSCPGLLVWGETAAMQLDEVVGRAKGHP